MQKKPLDFANVAGTEGLEYGQFVKLFGTRERANDVINPPYRAIGDIILPRRAVFHYQPQIPREVGPSNVAPFISNHDKRVNIFFNVDYSHVRGQIKVVGTQVNKIIKSYLAGHYNYHRALQISTALAKEGELLVNNLAIGRYPIVYRRVNVTTPFDKSYNELATVIDSANQFASYDVNQFVEFKLPRAFPTYKKLEDHFNRYKKNFFKGNKTEEGDSELNHVEISLTGWDKETMKPFQAEESFWILDLYGILMGFDNAKYSQFQRLTDKAKSQFNFVFTYNGRCWIANLQTLINLIGYDDTAEQKVPSALKINNFKRFYLSLINLVSQINEAVLTDIEETKNAPESKGVAEEAQKASPTDKKDPDVVADTSPRSLDELYGVRKERNELASKPSGDGTAGKNGSATQPGATEPTVGEDEIDPDEGIKWGDEVDDELFERATVESATVIEPNIPYSPTSTIDRMVGSLMARGQMTTREAEYFKRISQTYKEIDVGGTTLEQVVDIKPEDLILKPSKLGPDSDLVLDKSTQQSRTMDLVKGYNQEFLERDIMSCILAIQNGGTALLNLERETVVTAESKFDVYKMQVQPIQNGGQSTRLFRIPKLDEDDTFTISGTKIYSQLVRMEIPVRKLTPTKVKLTSYYDKLVMIERDAYKANDYAAWLKTNIVGKSYRDKTLLITLGGTKSDKKEVCWYYSVLAGRFKEIDHAGYKFQFDTPALIKDHPEWDKLCTAESWVVGVKGDKPITIDSTGMVAIGPDERGYIEEILGLDTHRAPISTSTVNINGYKFPSVVVLSYWMGFSELLKQLKTVYRTVEPGVRVSLGPDEYMVQFADERMILNRRDELSTLVLSGLQKLGGVSNFSRAQLDDPNIWFSLMSDSRVKPSHFKEMELIYDMFIDPMTTRELTKRGYPLFMDKLVLRGIEMLMSNEASHEVEITEQRFVGTERMAGHVYREVVKSTRQFRNKPGAKKTFDLNPEVIMMNIVTDPSFQSVEEVNPVHQIKQQEEVTFGGTFGRSDRAMVRRTRGQLDNYAGIISEAGKDSGKVGFISYLTSDAKIIDMAGNVDVDLPATAAGRGSITANLLYGTTRDDTKRSLFAGVQLSQWMATDSYQQNPLSTTYDTQIAYRTSELYSSIAKKNGVVKEVTDYGIMVEYDDKSTDKFFLGYDVGKGAGEYHKHLKVTDVKVGEKFEKGKVLAWDSVYFIRDTRDINRVVMRMGTMTRIALVEEQFTFEDSVEISKRYAERATTPYVKGAGFKVGFDQSLKVHVKVGDHVEYNQPLADIQDITSAVFEDQSGVMDGLDRMGIKQHKAPLPGKIVKIDVVYNGDIEDAEESVKKFVTAQDGVRGKKAQYRNLTAETGNVGGNTSIGKSKVYPNTVSVVIYIENKLVTTVADKFVAGNQMKGTVGYINPYIMYTEDGREVDWKFSLKSLLNRMVLSLRDKLVTNEVNHVYTSRMITKYGRYE